MSTGDSRTFLGFETGFLARAARELVRRHGSELERLVVLVPGRRAGRRLLEALLAESAAGSDGPGGPDRPAGPDRPGSPEGNWALEPPRIVTEAQLAPALARGRLALASQELVEWAWFETLGEAGAEGAEDWRAFAANPGGAGDAARELPFAERVALARRLAALDRDLAADEDGSPGEGSPGDVPSPTEDPRLAALTRLSRRVGERLARAGRVDPARALVRVRTPRTRRADVHVALVGVVELSRALRATLGALERPPTVLVPAPAEWRDGFDEFGGVRPEYFASRDIPLAESHWEVCDDPEAAGERAADWLAALPEGTRADEVALGLLSERWLVPIADALARRDGALHSAAGTTLAESSPWIALDALHGFLSRNDFASLAALLRHPALEPCVAAPRAEPGAARGAERAGPGPALASADRWHGEHLPDSLAGEFATDGRSEDRARLAASLAAARELVRELGASQELPLAAWTEPIGSLLARIFPTVPTGATVTERRTASALRWFANLGSELAALPEDFCRARLDGAAALRLWLDWAAEESLREERGASSVEALGWLELLLDDAPHVLVCGLNDGFVPRPEPSRPWRGAGAEAAREARSRLRLARDAFVLHVLAARGAARTAGESATSRLLVLSLRGAGADEPLRPSRLLFLAEPAVAIARARRFFGERDARPAAGTEAGAISPAERTPPGGALLVPTRPQVRRISVSGFRSFLKSPYLFYLEHVLGLERARDDRWELDPMGYGTLVHDVLERFGRGPARHSEDAAEIAAVLADELARLAEARFGERPLPAVRLQLQQLARRLERFAEVQARETRAGWRIEQVEIALEDARLGIEMPREKAGAQAGPAVERIDLEIRGRVDRIDRHRESGRWRVLDYKTGDDSDDPRAAHVRAGRWHDLQLPLYRHFLAPRLGEAVDVGYFAVPRVLASCGVHLADFKPEERDAALEEARRVAREVLSGDFARAGTAKPRDRIERALCGLSLLALVDDGNDGDAQDGEEAGGAGEEPA